MSRIKSQILLVLCAVLYWDASAFADGVLTPAASTAAGLPSGGAVNDCVLNTAPGTGTWQACPGAAGGDSVSIDGAAVVNPNFDSAGDIDFVDTANVITANVKANSVALGTDTTGNYALGDAEGGAATTGDSATAFFSAGTIEDARLPSSMADKIFTGSILLPNGTAAPGTCSIGMIYFDNDATAGVNLYGCTASNTWTLLGDGGAGGGAPTTSDYLVVTADAGLSAEVAVGKVDDTVLVANGTTWQAKTLTDCTDTGGNHLNYTASTNSYSCGTSASAGTNTYTVSALTANGSLTGTHKYVTCDATSGAVVITLPAAVTTSGADFVITKIDASTNACTITRASTDTILGATTAVLSTRYQSVGMISDGASTWGIF